MDVICRPTRCSVFCEVTWMNVNGDDPLYSLVPVCSCANSKFVHVCGTAYWCEFICFRWSDDTIATWFKIVITLLHDLKIKQYNLNGSHFTVCVCVCVRAFLSLVSQCACQMCVCWWVSEWMNMSWYACMRVYMMHTRMRVYAYYFWQTCRPFSERTRERERERERERRVREREREGGRWVRGWERERESESVSVWESERERERESAKA